MVTPSHSFHKTKQYQIATQKHFPLFAFLSPVNTKPPCIMTDAGFNNLNNLLGSNNVVSFRCSPGKVSVGMKLWTIRSPRSESSKNEKFVMKKHSKWDKRGDPRLRKKNCRRKYPKSFLPKACSNLRSSVTGEILNHLLNRLLVRWFYVRLSKRFPDRSISWSSKRIEPWSRARSSEKLKKSTEKTELLKLTVNFEIDVKICVALETILQ